MTGRLGRAHGMKRERNDDRRGGMGVGCERRIGCRRRGSGILTASMGGLADGKVWRASREGCVDRGGKTSL